MMSLQARLLLAGVSVLMAFIVLSGAGLESAFSRAALNAQEDRMRGMVYALLSAAEPDAAGGRLELNDGDLPEPRLMRHESGLEAAVFDEAGTVLWRSPSQAGALPVVIGPEVGRWKLQRLGDDGRFALSFGLRWIVGDERPQRYTVLVLEDPVVYEEQLATFRRTLRLWLAGAAAAVLAALVLVLRWGLRPLRKLVRELKGVESGALGKIEAAYPHELTPLTGALNAMIRSERGQLQRYRDALGDLAHSLKTPLAVLRGLSSDARLPDEARRQLDEQVGRMQQIADHQLSRAAAAGRRGLSQPVAPRPVAERIASALKKVYAARALTFDIEVPTRLSARVDAGDLHELLGNTLDNAAKWARSRVRLHAARAGSTLEFWVEDDGPGFPVEPERMLERGMRADDRVPGQGLGLAAVAEILRAYEGDVRLERSTALGGARVILRIPSA